MRVTTGTKAIIWRAGIDLDPPAGAWMVDKFAACPMYLTIKKAEPVESASLPLTPAGPVVAKPR